jgi:epoxyqueuosine reductase
MSGWIYGCDACQDVCPFNQKPSPAIDPAYMPMDGNGLVPSADLDVLIEWTEADYQKNLAGSAMKRATLDMLKRNAAIAEKRLLRKE